MSSRKTAIISLDNLYIEDSEDTPAVTLEPENNRFEISGRSFPEDAAEFYTPVIDWIKNYFDHNKQGRQLTIQFGLEYLNTASFRQIYKLLLLLSHYYEKDNDISVKWKFKAGDKNMREAGKRFIRLVNVPIELEEK